MNLRPPIVPLLLQAFFLTQSTVSSSQDLDFDQSSSSYSYGFRYSMSYNDGTFSSPMSGYSMGYNDGAYPDFGDLLEEEGDDVDDIVPDFPADIPADAYEPQPTPAPSVNCVDSPPNYSSLSLKTTEPWVEVGDWQLNPKKGILKHITAGTDDSFHQDKSHADYNINFGCFNMEVLFTFITEDELLADGDSSYISVLMCASDFSTNSSVDATEAYELALYDSGILVLSLHSAGTQTILWSKNMDVQTSVDYHIGIRASKNLFEFYVDMSFFGEYDYEDQDLKEGMVGFTSNTLSKLSEFSIDECAVPICANSTDVR